MPQRHMTMPLLPLLGTLALAAVLLFPGLGTAPIERAEIYFMDGARSMVERDDYLVPYYRGQPFFDKPALTYWLMAVSFHIFGFTSEAARLVSVLVALLVVSSTVWLGGQLFDRRAGVFGGIILATTLGFVSFGRLAMSDMLLTLCATLAMALAVAAFHDSEVRGWYIPAMGAALGLGFQTKGPVALLLPGLGILGLLWQRRRQRWPITVRGLFFAMALFAVLGLGWFACIFLRLGVEPLAYFFLRENLNRFAAATYDVGRGWWYYLPAYLALGLPWSPLLPIAGWQVLRRGPDGGSSRLLLGWMGLMAVLLSLSRGKIDYYLLPLLPAASLIIGHYMSAVPWGRLDRLWGRVILLLVGGVVGAMLPALIWRVPSAWLPSPALVFASSCFMVGGGVACLMTAFFLTPRRALVTLAAAAALLLFSFGAVFLPAFRAAQPHQEVVEDVLRVRQHQPKAELIVCEDHARLQRDLLFHARVAAQHRCDLQAAASSSQPLLLLLQPEERASLAAMPPLRELGEYRYLPASALTLRGFLAGLQPSTVILVANKSIEARAAQVDRYPLQDAVVHVH